MDIENVVTKLRNTINAAELRLAEFQEAGDDKPKYDTAELLTTQIDQLKHILQDVEVCATKCSWCNSTDCWGA